MGRRARSVERSAAGSAAGLAHSPRNYAGSKPTPRGIVMASLVTAFECESVISV